MEGRRLILNDGTVIENGEAGYSNGVLWCYFDGYTIQQAGSLFFNASVTAKITFEYGEMTDEYEGFNNCVGIKIDSDGKISVCLKRGG